MQQNVIKNSCKKVLESLVIGDPPAYAQSYLPECLRPAPPLHRSIIDEVPWIHVSEPAQFKFEYD